MSTIITGVKAARRGVALVTLATTIAACGGSESVGDAGIVAAPADPHEAPAVESSLGGASGHVADAVSPPTTTVVELQRGAGPIDVTIEYRFVEAGGLREVVIDSPAGIIGEHVVGADDHWFRIPPLAAAEFGIEPVWVHADLRDAVHEGFELPPSIAEVRAPLLDPSTVDVGDRLFGTEEVTGVDRRGDGSTLLTLADGDRAVLRRPPTPEGTRVEPPADAVDVLDLAHLVG